MDNMKKLLLLLAVVLTTACSQTPINNRYANANWSAIVIAPVEGKKAEAIEMEYDRQFSISDKVVVYSPDYVQQLLLKHQLVEQFELNPQATMLNITKKLNADAVLFSKVSTSKTKNQFTGMPITSLYTKLVSSDKQSVVIATHHEAGGIMTDSNITELVTSTVDDLNSALDKINPATKKAWYDLGL